MPNALVDQAMPVEAPPAPEEEAPPEDTAPDEADGAPDDDDMGPPPDPNAPTLASEGVDPDQLKDVIHKVAVINAKLAQILEDSPGPKIARSMVIKAVTEIVAEQCMSPTSAAQYLSDIPEDPGDIREWVQKHSDEAHMALAQAVYAMHGAAEPPPNQGAEAPPEEGAPPPEEQAPPEEQMAA